MTGTPLEAAFLLVLASALSAQQKPAEPWPWRTTPMGVNGMVAAEHPLQALAGLRVLESGGNAIDAAVAVFYMTGVTEQHQAGIGGDCVILVYLAKERKVTFVNGTGPAPALATVDFYRKLGGIPLNGPYSTNVPGSVAGFDLALRKYGTRDYATLLRDAIAAAEKGHAITRFAAREHADAADLLRQYPSSAQALLKNGGLYSPGDLFVQPDLGRTLRVIAREGPESFYRGRLADMTVKTYEKYHGLLRQDDLASFQPEESQPVHTVYKGYDVYQTAPNSQGLVMLMALNLLKGYPLRELGRNSPEYVHLVTESLKLAFADRDYYISDPRYRPVPVEGMLSAEYADARRRLIRPDHAIRGAAPPGDPEHRKALLSGRTIDYEAPPRPAAGPAPAGEGGDTSSFAIADRFGNVVSVTHSVNATFGAGIVIEGGGYVLNNRLPYFSLDAGDVNVLAPRKRTLHTICSAIALRDGKPVMAWNTPGGDNQPQALLQAFLNIVEFGMDAQQALEQPTVTTTNLHPTMYPHTPGNVLLIPQSLASKIGHALAAKGHRLQIEPLQQPYFQQTSGAGAVKMITIDPATGVMRGAVSPAKDDYAAGW